MINIVNLAYYREKDWNRFLKLIDDRESMHDKWKDWLKALEKLEAKLTQKGFIVRRIEVDINKPSNHCRLRGLKIDDQARSQFVQQKQD